MANKIEFRWDRIDKIPIITLKWSQKLLSHYADFVLFKLRENSENSCQMLPSFDQLLGNSSAVILAKMRQPRDLHIYMAELIKFLNEYCLDRDPPFIASVDDVMQALDNAKKQMLKSI